jgi:DME family drug/metabolite transporter
LWAISSILLKSQTGKIDALHINAVRAVFAAAFFLAILPVFGEVDQLTALPLSGVIYLLVSVVIGMVLGDTLYIKGMAIIGVARALPISITYPIFVLPFSVILVGESISILTVVGILITATGLYVITKPKNSSEKVSSETRRQYWWGISLLLMASLCWAAGTTLLKSGIGELDLILASAIRMSFMAAVLLVMTFLRRDKTKTWYHGPKSLTILALAGIVGIGVGGLFFIIGLKYAGSARTAILSATAPLFGVPLSMIMLRERVTVKIVLGTILCVVGIWLVIPS